jgi:hypothetical protein
MDHDMTGEDLRKYMLQRVRFRREEAERLGKSLNRLVDSLEAMISRPKQQAERQTEDHGRDDAGQET